MKRTHLFILIISILLSVGCNKVENTIDMSLLPGEWELDQSIDGVDEDYQKITFKDGVCSMYYGDETNQSVLEYEYWLNDDTITLAVLGMGIEFRVTRLDSECLRFSKVYIFTSEEYAGTYLYKRVR